jgi:hypothetical protein
MVFAMSTVRGYTPPKGMKPPPRRPLEQRKTQPMVRVKPQHVLMTAVRATCVADPSIWTGDGWQDVPGFSAEQVGDNPRVVVEYHQKTGLIRRILVNGKNYPDECHLFWADGTEDDYKAGEYMPKRYCKTK